MPMYAFACEYCGTVAERLVPADQRVVVCGHVDDAGHACPYTAQRLPSAPAFVVNGFSAKNRYSR